MPQAAANGILTPGITHAAGAAGITILSSGTYKVTFSVSGTEPNQMGLALSACGSAESPTILDTEKVERAIGKSVADQRGVGARVSCPSGVHQLEGLKFSCTAVVREVSTQFVVTELDGSGHVHYEAP